ncbi:MFS transporter [Rickettsia endosymbiont of Polydrusus tereticollis]|uniref:MFS transporter n=1 Tax=Rickettsia endosymbiont of Polydrusus tereticollis TaxID=3066251 RepID=UPI003132C7F8
MPLKVDYKTIFFSLLGIFFFSCINSTYFYILKPFLLIKGLNGEQLEHLAQTRLLGFIIAAFSLTQLINKLSNKKIIITSSFIVIINIINLIIFNNYTIIEISLVVMNGAAFAYFTAVIMHIIESANDKKYLFLSLIIFFWAGGHIAVSFLKPLLKPNPYTMVICALLYCINILTELLHTNKTPHNLESNSKFSLLIKNIELQLLTGFIVAYVAFDTLWYYEAFALKQELALISSNIIFAYIFKAIFFSIIPMSYILNKANKYFANLLLILILLGCFILLPLYGMNQSWNILLIILVGICLCSIFICNLLILLDKFKAYDLRTAIFSYFSMYAVGVYAGALSSSTPYGLVEGNDFLFSIFAVVGTFVVYYFCYFIKHRLYKH